MSPALPYPSTTDRKSALKRQRLRRNRRGANGLCTCRRCDRYCHDDRTASDRVRLRLLVTRRVCRAVGATENPVVVNNNRVTQTDDRRGERLRCVAAGRYSILREQNGQSRRRLDKDSGRSPANAAIAVGSRKRHREGGTSSTNSRGRIGVM